MKYLSICSGIEAATVAWHPLGWHPLAFSEIEKFPSAVLAHHWPDVPNLGDMTKFNEWPDTLRPDLLVGGTPCQAFSVAGLRKGLADPRGNLTLTFLSILSRYRPRWMVWENVPGVLSDKSGAFGAFLGGLAELGYGTAYRVLDAQHFGVPQRRRRVFVIGCLGDWRRAAAVLFERESLQRNPPPCREKGERAAGSPKSRSHWSGGVHPSLNRGGVGGIGMSNQEIFSQQGAGLVPDVADCLQTTCGDYSRADGFNMIPTEIVHTLRGVGYDASEDGTGRGTPIVAVNTGQGYWKEAKEAGTLGTEARRVHENNLVCVHGTQDPCTDENLAFALGRNSGQENAIAIQERAVSENPDNGPEGKGWRDDGQAYPLEARSTVQAVAFSCKDHGGDAGDQSPTLRSMSNDSSHANGGGQVAVAFAQNTRDEVREMEVAGALAAQPGMKQQSFIQQATAVRRLTPTECERLQGFPDGHTLIPWRDKPAADCPDGPRYKALGNSMAVPVMEWIGQRIAFVDNLPES